MSMRLNSADRVVLHALSALVVGFHPKTEDVTMFVDSVRHALPHMSDHIPVIYDIRAAGMALVDLSPSTHDGRHVEWTAWRNRVYPALVAYHRLAAGHAQKDMQDALARAAA